MLLPSRPRAAAGRVRRRVRTLQATPGIERRLVWCFGSPRSGSTWLWQLMCDHPGVVAINEPLIGWYLGPFLSELPGFSSAELTSESFTLRQAQIDKPAQFFANEFKGSWQPALGRMMRARFAAHVGHYPAASASPSAAAIFIKEPNGSQSADLIMEALPKSRLLFLLRDGRDVVDSELAANTEGSWVTREFPGATGIGASERLAFVRHSAKKWLWRTEVVERTFAAHAGPKLMMRYEHLLADTRPKLRSLLEWMGAPVDDARLESMVSRNAFESVPAEQRGPAQFYRAASPGLWRENLTEAERAAMLEIIGTKVAALGYE